MPYSFLAGLYMFASSWLQLPVVYPSQQIVIAETQLVDEEATVAGVLSEEKSEEASHSVEIIPIVSPSEVLWKTINTYRAERGLAAFSKDQTVCGFTTERLKQVKTNGEIDAHQGFEAHMQSYMKQAGLTKIAENLAQGYSPQDTVYKGWEESPPHKEVLQSSEYEVGCVASDGVFSVLIVGKR